MLRRFTIIVIVAWFAMQPLLVTADTPIEKMLSLDSLNMDSAEKNRRMYDSLAVKAKRHKVSQLLYNILVVNPKAKDAVAGKAIDESVRFRRFQGKIIGDISIERLNVFKENGNWFQRAGNNIHILTRERIIRRDILMHTGDTLNADMVVRNEQILKSRPYISNVTIFAEPDELDSMVVNLRVVTRDKWTISLDAEIDNNAETTLGIYDANILGTGTKLGVKTNFNRRTFKYGGNVVEYQMPNMFGSFFRFDASIGRTFDNAELCASVVKEFIKPTDYEVGVSYAGTISDKHLIDEDINTKISVSRLDAWAGLSHYIPKIESSIYIAGSYGMGKFSKRPKVAWNLHPAFHNYDNLLVGVGLYREKFMTTNLVYGFGIKEYIATGYKAEIVTGYRWSEFGNDTYLGLNLRSGYFTNAGYFSSGITLGSYIVPKSGAWHQSAVDLDFRWFSNLYKVRRCHLRQFTSINYTQGWNRYYGNNESIDFGGTNVVRMLNDDTYGTNRMAWNNEIVVFTPWQPLGFHVAFVGFFDIGLIGRDINMFKNHLFSTIGIGVRIKNERLIFKTITLRLGLALGKGGLVDCDYAQLTNSYIIRQFRYQPSRPEIVEFD